jgi:hypothetical protein
VTATSGLVEIACDGPENGTRCPVGARDDSLRWTAEELRDVLAERGWEVGILISDLPAMDRCPRCGKGTA